jgi:glycosyltransferase involved in cell wall biosynthesis
MRLLVVSHPCVIPANQWIYAELLARGWDVRIVVPSKWRDEHHAVAFPPNALPQLEGRIEPRRIVLAGHPQHHFYVGRLSSTVERAPPDVVFVEQELLSLAGFQWARAAAARAIPFGVQVAENIDRRYSWPARTLRSWVATRAAFVVARSPTAANLARSWCVRGAIEVVPHAIPAWAQPTRPRSDRFTIGYAGRLVEEKGLRDLVSASRLVPGSRLLLVGDGPLRPELQQESNELEIEVDTSTTHERMAEAYARMDVLVLPSRTTPTWTEQFGRVLVEALSCGVPVVGSSSGEIPWVIATTGGGHVFPEGDVDVLTALLRRLKDDPEERAELGRRGREAVARSFSVAAAAGALDELLRTVLRKSAAPRAVQVVA